MKDGKTFDGTLSEARKGGERRGLERPCLRVATGRTVKIKADLARHL
jgi:hypothetical protein